MGQSSQMRVLRRKDGEGTVSDIVECGMVRIANIPARKLEQAKIGEVVRFMYNPGNSRSAYWMQGELERRVDKYTMAKESGFTRNRFTVRNLTTVGIACVQYQKY